MPLALPVYGSNPTQEATRGSGQVRHHRRGGCNAGVRHREVITGGVVDLRKLRPVARLGYSQEYTVIDSVS